MLGFRMIIRHLFLSFLCWVMCLSIDGSNTMASTGRRFCIFLGFELFFTLIQDFHYYYLIFILVTSDPFVRLSYCI